MIKLVENDWNPCNFNILLASPFQLSVASNIREQVASYPWQWLRGLLVSEDPVSM